MQELCLQCFAITQVTTIPKLRVRMTKELFSRGAESLILIVFQVVKFQLVHSTFEYRSNMAFLQQWRFDKHLHDFIQSGGGGGESVQHASTEKQVLSVIQICYNQLFASESNPRQPCCMSKRKPAAKDRVENIIFISLIIDRDRDITE